MSRMFSTRTPALLFALTLAATGAAGAATAPAKSAAPAKAASSTTSTHSHAAASSSAARVSLDGKSYQGQMAEKGQKTGEADQVTFTAGTFRSSEGDSHGFKPATYTATRRGKDIRFHSVARSDQEGTMTWNGTVKGNALDAKVVWQKKGAKPVEYWYRGQQQS